MKTTKNTHVAVSHSSKTKQIMLPEDMDLREAITHLERRMEEDERVVAVYEIIDAFPLDGAHALTMSLSDTFGWTGLIPTPGFFGSKPPAMVGVHVAHDEVVQVPWGRIRVPGVDGYVQTTVHVDKKTGQPRFAITGEVRRKHEKKIAEIAERAREYVRDHSIYAGKAIRVNFERIGNPEDASPTDFNPQFLDVSGVKIDELVFSDDVKAAVDINLFTPITATEECRRNGIPLKRGVLLAGQYGTGKTLTAYCAANLAEKNGWTFLYLEKVDQLPMAIQFANLYGPCVIFAEDIDEIMGTQDRNDKVNGVLNTIDGLDSKSSEVIVVLTTNHVENVNIAMLRPGRLDAVIHVLPPDAAAVEKLIKMYARGLLAEDVDLQRVGDVLQGRIPAVIREVVERSKLAAIARGGHKDGRLVIEGADLEAAAFAMDNHLRLLEPKVEDTRSDVEKAAHVLGTIVTGGTVEVAAAEPRLSMTARKDSVLS